MHSSRMRTARSLPYGRGSLSSEVSVTETPRQKHPWTETPQTETPLDRDPPGQRPLLWTETPPMDRDPSPGQRTPWTETSPMDRDLPPGQRSPRQRPLPWTKTPLDRDPHMNRITDKCKNITLSQTSFAGGNNVMASRWVGSWTGG